MFVFQLNAGSNYNINIVNRSSGKCGKFVYYGKTLTSPNDMLAEMETR